MTVFLVTARPHTCRALYPPPPAPHRPPCPHFWTPQAVGGPTMNSLHWWTLWAEHRTTRTQNTRTWMGEEGPEALWEGRDEDGAIDTHTNRQTMSHPSPACLPAAASHGISTHCIQLATFRDREVWHTLPSGVHCHIVTLGSCLASGYSVCKVDTCATPTLQSAVYLVHCWLQSTSIITACSMQFHSSYQAIGLHASPQGQVKVKH